MKKNLYKIEIRNEWSRMSAIWKRKRRDMWCAVILPVLLKRWSRDGENPFPQQLWTHYSHSNHAYALHESHATHRCTARTLLRRARPFCLIRRFIAFSRFTSFFFLSSFRVRSCYCLRFFPIIVSNTCSWSSSGWGAMSDEQKYSTTKVSLKHRKHLMIMQNDYIFSGKSRR